MENIKAKKRLGWLDIGKGIAMLFIMMSHTIWVPDIYCQFFKPIYLSFFFCASGFVFSLKNNFAEFFMNKFRTLMIPWFTLSVISILSSQIITTGNHTLKNDVTGLFLQIRGKDDYMWFIACLFVAELLFYVVVRYITLKFRYFVYVFGLAYSITLYKIGVGSLPWHLQTMGVALFLLGLGFEFKNNHERCMKLINTKMLVCSGLAYLVFMLFKLYVIKDLNVIRVNQYDNNAFTWIVGSLLALFFFLQIICKIENNRVLEFIGRNTLVYFAFQFKFQRVFEIMAGKINMPNWPFAEWYISFISVAFETIGLAVVAIIFNRYFYVLLGKKKLSS